jgi:hypothetical protein
MANMNPILKNVLQGVFNANAPELAGAVGAYLCFRDKPYALALAGLQITDSAIEFSAIGAAMPLVIAAIDKIRGGNSGRKRTRRRGRRNKRNNNSRPIVVNVPKQSKR